MSWLNCVRIPILGLLLQGDKLVQLVVLCAEKPTTALLKRVADELPVQLKSISEEHKYMVSTDPEEGAVLVTDDIITVKVSLTSPLWRDPQAQGKFRFGAVFCFCYFYILFTPWNNNTQSNSISSYHFQVFNDQNVIIFFLYIFFLIRTHLQSAANMNQIPSNWMKISDLFLRPNRKFECVSGFRDISNHPFYQSMILFIIVQWLGSGCLAGISYWKWFIEIVEVFLYTF